MSWVPIVAAALPLIGQAVSYFTSSGGSAENEGASSKNEGGFREKVIQYVTDPAIIKTLEMAQAMNAQFADQLITIIEKMNNQNIDSFEDLQKHDRRAAEALVQLARQVNPMELGGIHIGLFGITSTGKSTVINTMLGKKDDDPTRAAVGRGDTTRAIQGYDGNGYRLVDVPGKNDDLTYFTADYISFWKGLSHRLVLVTATLKEMTKVMRLLDEIDLKYDIVVTKFDLVKPNEADSFKQQIKREIHECGLKKFNKLFFISAENPKAFDWVALCDYITPRRN